jgi:hypothetical protein
MLNAASTIAKLQKNIDRIIGFLDHEFINCHMVTYLTDNLWTKFIPKGIRSEIRSNEDVASAIEVFFEQENARPELIAKHRHLFEHIQKTKTFYLENLPGDKLFITTDELLEEFKQRNIPHSTGLNLTIREFMKEKKNHEVEIIARLVAALSKARGKEHLIVDVGDGKGYLSSRLSLEFKLKVLGIDGNQQNTKEAEKRNQRLSKTWNALVKKEAKKKNVEIEVETETRKNDLYKTTSKMIFAGTNLKELAEEAFPGEDLENLCLVGLHTCGNLASNSLKQFVRNDEMKVVCSVGCCYHLLYEEFETDFFNDEERVMDANDEAGFPMSRHLRGKKFQLGRNGRMLAAQCFERVIANKNHPDESLFYRALFEQILREKWSEDGTKVKVLKLGKIKFKSFEEYFRKGCRKFNIDMEISPEKIEEMMKTFDHDRHLIMINYFIRLLNAKVVETLILLDRYLFLLESGVEDVFLVKIFDPVVSPRNYGFVALKK